MDFLIADELLFDETCREEKHRKPDIKSHYYRIADAIGNFPSTIRASKKAGNISTPNVHSWNAPEKSAYSGLWEVVQPDRGQGRARFQDVSEIEPRLWSEINTRMDSKPDMGRICIMGFDASQGDSIIGYLHRVAGSPNAFSASINDILEIATTHETVSMLVVNGDAFGDLPDTVDALKSLREIQPHISIVLVSSKVANDDLTDERKAICDATLSVPLTKARLDAAIRATFVNKTEQCCNPSLDAANAGRGIPMFRSRAEHH